MKPLWLLIALALFAPLALPAVEPVVAEDSSHASTDRAGDPSLFMDLFSHLTPHAVTAVWLGGEAGFATVKPYATDAAGNPLGGTPDHPEMFHNSAELREHYAGEMGGGTGFLIYNINTVMWLAAGLLLLVFVPMAGKARALAGKPPAGKGYGLLESLVCFVRDEMVYAVMGKAHGRRYVPLFLSFFFFILFMNILGLIPLGGIGGTATANLAVTAGLATISFLMTQWAGIRQNGFFTHWKNLVPHGLPVFVLPIIIPVEVLGMFVKPAALTIRLFANLTAGHLIVLGLFGLVYFFGSYAIGTPFWAMTVAIYGLELFVCFVQAYIFTYLSIVFLGAAVHPDH